MTVNLHKHTCRFDGCKGHAAYLAETPHHGAYFFCPSHARRAVNQFRAVLVPIAKCQCKGDDA
ncbi:hypothetical protein DR950_36000 [Kitasatospora xanthocidica]|uniref:Uncharacterized protein n=1 Tax=Kitasatospora xanthocidica TaxID=83382 RepID=A0A373A4C4_9ACTN|nr:hypothetical protein DR950_36000 [Kitasatospora xanthocidica]